MYLWIKALRTGLAIACLGILGTGCATNRGILHVETMVPDNPESGQEVSIGSVTDSRVFEAKPRDPSTPSLKIVSEINDVAITSRAIARKRNGYGKALGDILVSEDQSVASLVSGMVTEAFRESGYRVVESGGQAIPVNVDIKRFWMWFSPGAFNVGLDFWAELVVSGDVAGFKEGKTIENRLSLKAFGAGTRQWTNTLSKGMDGTVEKLKKEIKQ